MSITAHMEAVESLLAGMNARVDSKEYPYTTVHVTPGEGRARRMCADFTARHYLVHTNVSGIDKRQANALLDRCLGLEGLRPVVAGRFCDPLTVFASSPVRNEEELPDRTVWFGSIVWSLTSYAA